MAQASPDLPATPAPAAAAGSLFVVGPGGRRLSLVIGGGIRNSPVPLQDGRAWLSGLPAKTVTVQLKVRGLDQPFERQID